MRTSERVQPTNQPVVWDHPALSVWSQARTRLADSFVVVQLDLLLFSGRFFFFFLSQPRFGVGVCKPCTWEQEVDEADAPRAQPAPRPKTLDDERWLYCPITIKTPRTPGI